MKRRIFAALIMLASVAASLFASTALAAPGDPGGVKGTAVAVIKGETQPCSFMLLNFAGPIKKPVGADENGNFNTGLILPPGNYTVSGSCRLSIAFNFNLPVKDTVTVLSDQTVTLNLRATDSGGTEIPEDPPLVCDAGPGLTWLICGTIRTVVGMIDWIRDHIIVPFLHEKPLDKNDAEVAPLYAIWSAFRNVASVFFILIFFLIIFGTAIGWDNYTVKKALPRLVAGAIFVPFSWYLCVALIDIGNVLGQGVVSLLSSVMPPVSVDFTSNMSKIVLGGVLIGATAAASVALATIGMGVIVSVAIAFIGVFFILVLRKILITLLVILSPFAFVAWILPNTSKWFQEWWTNLLKLVMMYPIIMLLFEAGRLFAATAGATSGNFLEKGVTPLFQIAGLSLPLFAVPFAFSWAGKALKLGGGAVGKVTNGLNKRYGKDSDMAKERAEQRRLNNARRALDFANNPLQNSGKAGVRKLGMGLGAARRGLALKRSGLGGFTGHSGIPILKNNAAQKQRINAAGAKAEADIAQSEAQDAIRNALPQTSAERIKNQRAAQFDKLFDAHITQAATSVKNHDGVAIRDIPLDNEGVAWLKQQVRVGGKATQAAALQRLSSQAKGENAIMELRTGTKIVQDPVTGVFSHVPDHVGEQYRDESGQLRDSTAFSMGGTDGLNVDPKFKDVWDKGTINASVVDAKKALSSAAADISPENLTKLSVFDAYRYLDYYQRNAGNEKADKAAAQFNAAFQQAITNPNLQGRMYPGTVEAVADAGKARNAVISPETARLAEARMAQITPAQRTVSPTASRQILAAAGGDIARASEIHAQLKADAGLRQTLENKILEGRAIEATDLQHIPTAARASTMPARIQQELATRLENDLDQLARTHQAYESDQDYRESVHQHILGGKTPPPPPR